VGLCYVYIFLKKSRGLKQFWKQCHTYTPALLSKISPTKDIMCFHNFIICCALNSINVSFIHLDDFVNTENDYSFSHKANKIKTREYNIIICSINVCISQSQMELNYFLAKVLQENNNWDIILFVIVTIFLFTKQSRIIFTVSQDLQYF
jgi:hypothetical protein